MELLSLGEPSSLWLGRGHAVIIFLHTRHKVGTKKEEPALTGLGEQHENVRSVLEDRGWREDYPFTLRTSVSLSLCSVLESAEPEIQNGPSLKVAMYGGECILARFGKSDLSDYTL